MSTIGPSLPAHLLAKRKRQQEEEAADRPNTPPTTTVSTSPRPSSPDYLADPPKRRRIAGPAPPPAPLAERPSHPPDIRHQESDKNDASSSDTDSDDIGPAPPSATELSHPSSHTPHAADPTLEEDEAAEPPKPARDEWMLLPPKQDDLAARMDPSKQRARGFNTGKGAKGPSSKGQGGMDSTWTETAEEKKRRLRDEVLGVSSTSGGRDGGSSGGAKGGVGKDGNVDADEAELRRKKEDEDKARRIREYNQQHRGQSLYEQHQGRFKEGKKEEDDPSKRGFNWEKDMGGGVKVGHRQRAEMLKRAGDFGSRFGGGKFL